MTHKGLVGSWNDMYNTSRLYFNFKKKSITDYQVISTYLIIICFLNNQSTLVQTHVEKARSQTRNTIDNKVIHKVSKTWKLNLGFP
jgi:hypothetical protein